MKISFQFLTESDNVKIRGNKHNEIIGVIISRTTRLAGRIVRMERRGMRTKFGSQIVNGRGHLGDLMIDGDNIKMELIEIGCEGVD
jgi:hypothetical protein